MNDESEVIGHIELGLINKPNGTASICRVFLDHEWRGRGICKEMVRRVLEIGFEQLNLRRIDLRVYAFNQAAVSCYEHAGLVREGVLRKALRVGDQFWDTVNMAILKEEWEK